MRLSLVKLLVNSLIISNLDVNSSIITPILANDDSI